MILSKKTEYNKLVKKVNNISTTYDADKSDLEKKISDVDKKIPDTSDLAKKKTDLNAIEIKYLALAI